jgi:hypothetical protein
VADAKITALTALTTPASDDLFPIVDDVAGTPVTKKIALSDLSATQAEMETATDTVKWCSPGRVHFHPGVAKFWACITVSGGTPTLATSYNMTSIADTGTGICTLTIATDFSSANWTCQATGTGAGTAVSTMSLASASSKAAGTVVITVCDASATPVIEDPVSYNVVGFGDQ